MRQESSDKFFDCLSDAARRAWRQLVVERAVGPAAHGLHSCSAWTSIEVRRVSPESDAQCADARAASHDSENRAI